MAGKPFIVLSTNEDLPTNPMSLRECLVCGEVFTHEQSREDVEILDHFEYISQSSLGCDLW